MMMNIVINGKYYENIVEKIDNNNYDGCNFTTIIFRGSFKTLSEIFDFDNGQSSMLYKNIGDIIIDNNDDAFTLSDCTLIDLCRHPAFIQGDPIENFGLRVRISSNKNIKYTPMDYYIK